MYLGFEPIGASSMKLKQRAELISVDEMPATVERKMCEYELMRGHEFRLRSKIYFHV